MMMGNVGVAYVKALQNIENDILFIEYLLKYIYQS